ncbi:MAG: type II toxin-antitoxin system VapC family toxin [bacterium]|nr:type II toxin-antitoxin system VapC family toxin [bacterium]
MIIGIDTDVLVHWAMAGAVHHRAVRQWFEREIGRRRRFGLTQQVLYELVHVVSDPRRFERSLTMEQAVHVSLELWNGKEVHQILPTATVYDRTCELIERFELGRKRILDTALAATLEAADVHRLATLNPRDFEIFPFLELVNPTLRPQKASGSAPSHTPDR